MTFEQRSEGGLRTEAACFGYLAEGLPCGQKVMFRLVKTHRSYRSADTSSHYLAERDFEGSFGQSKGFCHFHYRKTVERTVYDDALRRDDALMNAADVHG